MEKLVRDFIPAIIRESGENCNWRYVDSKSEHLEFLVKKIQEEAYELIDAIAAESVREEAGDLYEVFQTLLNITGVSLAEAQAAAKKKTLSRGSFKEGVILEMKE
jgi:predicted house-cleaning noncanonical NTP pyrophosphatase (MazG superfamily)